MKRIERSNGRPAWRWHVILFGAILAAIMSVYVIRLGTLVPASRAEQGLLGQLASLGGATENFIMIPYRLLAWSLVSLPGDDLTQLRLASAVMAAAASAILYLIVRRWHGRPVALAAGILFATSTWTLSNGRNGLGLVMLSLAVLALIGSSTALSRVRQAKEADRSLLAFALAASLALMTPGGIWFLLVAAIVSYKPLVACVRLSGSAAIKAGAGSLIALGTAVFILGCLQVGRGLRTALGLMTAQTPDGLQIAKQLALSVSGFFFRGPDLPALWLPHTPLLDIASATMAVMGAILYVKHISNSRTRLLLAFVVTGMLLTSLNGGIGLSYLSPVIYLLIASGIAYFYHQWHKVFPRNPVATTVAVTALGMIGIAVLGFHMQRYFVVWPSTPSVIEYRQPQTAARSI